MFRAFPILACLLITSMCSATAADTLHARWVQHEGGLGGSSGDWVTSVQRDAVGNVFVTGFFFLETVIGSTHLTGNPVWGIAYFIVKYTPDGKPVLVRHSDGPASFHVDSAGNIYQFGRLAESNTVAGTTLFATNGASYVAKFTSAGEFAWVSQGGGSNDYPGVAALAVSETGIILAGGYQGEGRFGGTNVAAAANTTLFVAKLSHAGEWTWVQSEPGERDGGPGALRVLSDGGFALSMYRWGGGLPELRRYTATGSLVWTQKIAGGWTMAVDTLDDIYVGSTFQGQPTVAGQTFTNTFSGANDILLTKFAANGTRLWNQHIRGNGDDRLAALAITPDQRLCLSGTFGNSSQFNIATASFSGLVLTNPAAGNTGFIAEYNSDGTIHRAAATINGTFTSGMTVLDDGEWCVAGSFANVRIGESELRTRGLLDFYVVRLTTNVVDAPAITLNTVSHSVAAGEQVVLRTSIINGTDAEFQWSLNGVNIPGATNAELIIDSASTNDIGRYSVVVRTPAATVVNSTVALLVNPETDMPWPAWVTRAKATNWSTVRSLDATTNGDCYIAGSFITRMSLGTNSFQGMPGGIFAAKLREDGNVAWAHAISPLSPSYGSAYDCRTAPDGGVYVLCFSATPTQHDDGQTLPAGLLLLKHDSSGLLLWNQKVGATNLNYSQPRIALSPEGAALVTSSYSGGAHFGTTNLPSPSGAFVAEYTRDGVLVSVRQASWISALAVTTNAIYYARNGSELVKADRGWNTRWSQHIGARILYIIPHGEHLWLLNENGLLRKLNDEGQTLWQQSIQLGGPPALAVSASGHAYVTGVPYAGNGDYWYSTIENSPDTLVVECDPAGVIVSIRQLGSAGVEQATAIAIGHANTLYIGGTMEGDVAINGTVSLGTPFSEAFVCRFDAPPNSYPPHLEIAGLPSHANLRWLTRDTNWIIESSPAVSGPFASKPIPNISRHGRTNIYTELSTNQMFYRLRRKQ